MPVPTARRTLAAGRPEVWRVLADPEWLAGWVHPEAALPGRVRADTSWPATGSVTVVRHARGRPLLLTVLSCHEQSWLHLLVGRWPREEVVRLHLSRDGHRTCVTVDRAATGVRLLSRRARRVHDLGRLARLEEVCRRSAEDTVASPEPPPVRTLSPWG